MTVTVSPVSRLLDAELVDRVTGRAVAGLIEGQPLVGQRIVDHDSLLQNLPAVLEHDQIAGELLRPATPLVEADLEIVAPHFEADRDRLFAEPWPDLIDRLTPR